MGIERFFSTVEDNPIANTMKPFLKKIIKGTKNPANYLLIDFNSILHTTSGELVAKLNILLLKIILQVVGDDVSMGIINKYNLKWVTKSTTYEEYVKKLTKEVIDDLVIDGMEDCLRNIISNVVTADTLRVLYIAMDGTPNKAKMQEQRNRRWVSYILEELQQRIYKKYEDELKQHSIRNTYETNKIHWSNRSITVATPFMDKVEKRLVSREWIQFIRQNCLSLHQYIYSGYNIPGEGEFKIVCYLRSQKISEDEKIIIYSPDSDVILLSMLLETNIGKFKPLSNISIITNQKQKMTDLSSVDTFIGNIYDYVHKKGNRDFNKWKLIRDLVFLFTVFGNDFVPRIESFDVSQNFSMLIDKYIEATSDKEEYIIIDENNYRVDINHNLFLKVLDLFKDLEENLLYTKYLSSQCLNYKKLQKLFAATSDNFIEQLEKFLKVIQLMIKNIDNGKKIDDDIKFDDYYELLTNFVQLDETDYPVINMEDLKKKLTTYVENHKSIDISKLKFVKYPITTDSEMHKKNIERNIKEINVDFKVLNYDTEMYALQNMLDKYHIKFNNKKTIIGKVSVDHKKYLVKRKSYDQMRSYYYKKVIHSTDEKDIIKFIKAYIEGYIWVFEYYYNAYERTGSDTWWYQYTKTPLLSDFYEYYKNNIKEVENIQKNIIKSVNKPRYQFYPLEQLIYVSVNLNDYGFSDEILNLQKELIKEDIYPNIEKMIDKIWNDDKNNILDCRGHIFQSKCHIKKNNLKISDLELIKLIRSKHSFYKRYVPFVLTMTRK